MRSGGGGNGGNISPLSVALFTYLETVSLQCSREIKNILAGEDLLDPLPLVLPSKSFHKKLVNVGPSPTPSCLCLLPTKEHNHNTAKNVSHSPISSDCK